MRPNRPTDASGRAHAPPHDDCSQAGEHQQERDAERRAAMAEREADRMGRETERQVERARQQGELAARSAPAVRRWTSPDGKIQTIEISVKDGTSRVRNVQKMVIDSSCRVDSRKATAHAVHC